MIISHTGKRYGATSTWIRFTPLATEALAIAADLVRTDPIRITAYDPDGGPRMAAPRLAGIMQVGNRTTHVTVATRGTDKNPTIRDMDRTVLSMGARHLASQSITIEPDAVAASRLWSAASIAVVGHDVILSITGDELNVCWSTEQCPCPSCVA